jgi:hypothetical protein
MKYVVMQVVSKTGMRLEVPFLFPDVCVHSVIAKALLPGLHEHWEDCDITPISAGFLSSMDIDASCDGESESLKLKSRGEEDDRLIRMSDYGSINC